MYSWSLQLFQWDKDNVIVTGSSDGIVRVCDDVMVVSWDVMVMSWWCHGNVMVMSLWCHGDVMVMSGWCHGDVMVMSWWCQGDVMVMSCFYGSKHLHQQGYCISSIRRRDYLIISSHDFVQLLYKSSIIIWKQCLLNSVRILCKKSFINKWHKESQLSSNGSASRQQSFFVVDGEYLGRVFMMLGLVPKRQYVENDPFKED